MYTSRVDPFTGINLYRGLVVRSNKTTGEVLVKVPELLGGEEAFTLSKDFLERSGSVWIVPDEGAQVIVGLDGPRARLVYVVSELKIHQPLIYGSFYEPANQTANTTPNTARPFKYTATAEAYGISIVDNTKIKIPYGGAGVYNIQFSAQIDKTDSGQDALDIWLAKNGTYVEASNTTFTMTANNARSVAAWNWVISAKENDYFEIYWSSADHELSIVADTAQTNPTRPSIPSVILTIYRMS